MNHSKLRGVWLLGFFLAGCATPSPVAVDKGPAEIILVSTLDPAPTPKPARFPHAAHQARMGCGACHHRGMANGNKLSYTEGQKIYKCEECHNTTHGMDEQIDTFKEVAHIFCLDCHRKIDPKMTQCTVCHKE